MKKTIRPKLNLSLENVRALTERQLEQPNGAIWKTETGYSVCYGTCASFQYSCESQCLCQSVLTCICHPQ